MNTRKIAGRLLPLALALMVGVATGGCGGDGNGNGENQFRAYIQNFGGEDLVSGITVQVMDNDTGEQIGLSAESDGTGWVTIQWEGTPPAKAGFFCEGQEGEWVDTYQFNIDATAQDERLWVVSQTTYLGAPLMAGLTIEEGKAVVAGGLYWVNQEDTEVHVGCATVKADPEEGDVRYFDDNGNPTTLANRDTTNPLVAYYLIGNLTPGEVLTRAYVEATEIGSTSFFGYADSICISNIYADTPENPEPAGCRQ